MKKRCYPEDILQYKNHLKKMKREREKLRQNQIRNLLKTRSCKDIWSLYTKTLGKTREDVEVCLNPTNKHTQCADQLAKAFHNKVER